MDDRPKILMVDDRQENLLALEVTLKDMEVQLIKATNGNEALALTLHHKFALALIDIQMPDMDGYELATILRSEEQTADLPFIFISAVYNDRVNIFKGYEKGAFDFISKPFQPEILINKVKLFVSIYQHETVLKRLNENLEKKNDELRFLNAELESFSYSVSHDLRAPLRAISGYAGMLLEDHIKELTPDAENLVHSIGKNVKRMESLIESLLTLSKMGRKELKKGPVETDLLVKTIIEEIPASDDLKKVTWSIGKLYSCNGDYNLLKQVFSNLISNAVKYSAKKEKPQIEISAEKTDKECIYCIKDNGAGFNQAYADKLFGVFQRLHRADEFEGNGVGLAIVNKIVTRHGGWINAEGEVNNGATFCFAIPA